MIYNNPLYRAYFIVFVFASHLLFSQEGLRPLGSNLNYFYEDLKPEPARLTTTVSQQKNAAAGSISLPFIEDFYYATTSYYPDPNKWSDSLVFVNCGMARAPMSIGVATFDGLNKHGYPYNPTLANLTISSPADVLTSQPINLHTSAQQTLDPYSEVALSFYYQARGNGDPPEQSDSLLVDFYRPYVVGDSAWKNVWFVTGTTNSNTNDSAFKRAFIRITDTAYFHDGFRFRFRNWASVTGNFDHWHVDYIFLDKNRGDSLIDTTRNDITFGGRPTSFLRDYSEMPFQQYNSSEMASKLSVRIRNNSRFKVNMFYTYQIHNDQGQQVFPDYQGQAQNLNPFWKNSYSPPGYGYSTAQPHANPPVVAPFVLPSPPVTFNYAIKHFIFMDSADVIRQNDTMLQHQFFRDFYAFDDGSAEAGYYVNVPLAKMAVKIRTNVMDTLQALRIYFDPAGNVSAISNTATSAYSFTINIWSLGSDGGPGDVLYQDSVRYVPSYSKTGFKEIPEFRLKRPYPIAPGTYFMGFQQASNTITVGFDKNFDYHSSLYFNASGVWKQSQIPGSIMIRPLFRNILPEIVGLGETDPAETRFIVYPNPAPGEFTILSAGQEGSAYQLFNTMGQMMKEGRLESRGHIVSASELPEGVYILVLRHRDRTVQQQKIIIQH